MDVIRQKFSSSINGKFQVTSDYRKILDNIGILKRKCWSKIKELEQISLEILERQKFSKNC